MYYPSIHAVFHSTIWAILPEKLEEIRAFLATRFRGEMIPEEEVQRITAGRRVGQAQINGKVAVLPIFGVLSQRVGMLERASGGVSTEEVGATLDSLAADKAVRSIVLAIDSPGGSVYGVQELADKVRAVAAQKKVIAVADSVAASAAYWVGSQANEFAVTPGGQVGSIGVLVAHTDVSKAEEAAGQKTSYITSSPYKVEGAPEQPLTEEARTELQAKVDHYHAMFVRAIAKGRNVSESKVNSEFGQGRMVTARDAVSRGMADRVTTLEQVLTRLGAEGGVSASAMAMRARAVAIQD